MGVYMICKSGGSKCYGVNIYVYQPFLGGVLGVLHQENLENEVL